MRRLLLCALIFTAAGGCGRTSTSAPPAAEPADARVRALADAYVSGFFERYPEQVTSDGVPGRTHDRLTDNSLPALAAWEQREDAWLTDVRAIDPATIADTSLASTSAILRETLESSAVPHVPAREAAHGVRARLARVTAVRPTR